jgi:hypothetical protein
VFGHHSNGELEGLPVLAVHKTLRASASRNLQIVELIDAPIRRNFDLSERERNRQAIEK